MASLVKQQEIGRKKDELLNMQKELERRQGQDKLQGEINAAEVVRQYLTEDTGNHLSEGEPTPISNNLQPAKQPNPNPSTTQPTGQVNNTRAQATVKGYLSPASHVFQPSTSTVPSAQHFS